MVGKFPCVFQKTLEIPLVAYNNFSVHLGGSQAVNESHGICIIVEFLSRERSAGSPALHYLVQPDQRHSETVALAVNITAFRNLYFHNCLMKP